jgi:hypothetical protein
LWFSYWEPEGSDIVEVGWGRSNASVSRGLNVQINGKTFRRGLGCDGVDFPGNYCEYSYNLSRKYRRFAAYVGIDDTSSNSNVVNSFEVIGDGDVIATQVVGFGERKRIVANVANVLRLTVRISAVSSETEGSEASYFTDPRVSRYAGLYPAAPIG